MIVDKIKKHSEILEIEVVNGSNDITHEYAGYLFDMGINFENDKLESLEIFSVKNNLGIDIEVKESDIKILETYFKKYTDFIVLDSVNDSQTKELTDPYESRVLKQNNFL